MQSLFGAERVGNRSEKGQKQATLLLAKKLRVKPDEVTIRKGRAYLGEAAYAKLTGLSPRAQDISESGGNVRHLYEFAEMAYNDTFNGTIQSTGGKAKHFLVSATRALTDKLSPKLKAAFTLFNKSGGLQVLAGAGMLGTAAVGLWLTRLGGKQLKQSHGRGDSEQAWSGARSTFLGAEALAASAAFASKTGSNVVTKVLGKAASVVALPLAWAHGVIDLGQGVMHISEGIKSNNNSRILEGAAEVGMGAGWLAAAYTATPFLVLGSCVCLGVKISASLYGKAQAKKTRLLDAQLAQEASKYVESTFQGEASIRELAEPKVVEEAKIESEACAPLGQLVRNDSVQNSKEHFAIRGLS